MVTPNLHWIALSKAQEIEELPHITRAVLGELKQPLARKAGPEKPGPFVYTRHGKSVIDSV